MKHRTAVDHPYAEAAVDHPVVGATEQNEIRERCLAAVGPMHRMVRVAPPWWTSAAGEATTSVADGDRPPEPRRHDLGAATELERFQDRNTARWIDNFPNAHIVNGEDKDADGRTYHWYKPTIIMFKNARDFLIHHGDISDGLAPSYFVEGLLYNVPDLEFSGSHAGSFGNCLKWLNKANFNGFSCQNELVRLFGPWDQPKAREFVDQLMRL